MGRSVLKRSALFTLFLALSMTTINGAPLLKMQFTDDTANAAPATTAAIQGGVSVKPTSLYVYSDTSILVRSNPIDSGTSEIFEASNAVEIVDNNLTQGATVRFDGDAADSASGSDKVRIDLDLMIDSVASATGNMFVILKQNGTNTTISSVSIGLSSGTISLANYNSSGTYIDSTDIGVAPTGKSFHLQIKLDYATGVSTVKADGLLYTTGALACTKTITGTFANNISFGRLDVSTGTTSTGKVLVDNISINAVPDLSEASVATYGAVGNGSTDDTAALSSALSALGTSISKLTLESGKTYLISSPLNMSNKKDFIIDGNNSTIKIADGTPVSGYYGIQFTKCGNFTVQNLVFDANRSTRTPAEVYAHSIIIRGCTLFNFINTASNNAVVDGFYVSAYTPADAETVSRNGIFLNCSADNCYRQGMSIINGHHIYVVNSSYNNTNGTPPQAGIDIEANSGSCEPSNMDITIRNSTFSGNEGFGVQISYKGYPRNITFEDCNFSDNADGGIKLGSAYSIVKNNFFENFTESIRGIVDLPSTLEFNAYNIVADNWFKNIQTSQPVIYVHGDAGAYNSLENNLIMNYNWSDNCGDDDGIYVSPSNITTTLSGNTTTLSPVGHWALNEGTGTSLADSSGNNISGVTYNNPDWVTGQYGYALSFDGSNQYALIADDPLLDITDHFTLSAWIYADANASTAQHMVIGKSGDFRFGYSGWSDAFGLYSPNAIGRWVYTSVSKGNWHHVAATYNGTRVRLYVDGVMANEQIVKPGSVGTAYRVSIGSYGGTTYPFDGIIDDVRIYDVVLSSSEIENL